MNDQVCSECLLTDNPLNDNDDDDDVMNQLDMDWHLYFYI